MASTQNPLSPAGTASLSCSSSNARVALAKSSNTVMVTAPAGGAVTFIKFGSSTVTAAVTDTPILPGSVQTFSIPPDATYVAGITASSTQTLYFTSGEGV